MFRDSRFRPRISVRHAGIGLILMISAAGCLSPKLVPPQAEGITIRSSPVEQIFWPERLKWRTWGAEYLQSGDLVFIRSNYRMLLGTFNLSEFVVNLTGSPFSHVGLVVVESGTPMVYDASDKGVTAQPFEKFVTSGTIARIAVARPHVTNPEVIDQAVEFVRFHRTQKTRFDSRFKPGCEQLYCTELIIEAFRAGGVELCQPTVLGELPGLATISPTVVRLAKLATQLDESDSVYLPGNESAGLFSSPDLQVLLER